jgi:hypothetical protein
VIDAEDARRIALSLPQTAEREMWQIPTFHVAGHMFVTIPDDQSSCAVRCPKSERRELIASEPQKFWVPPHEAYSSWVRVRFEALDDLDELHDIIVDSWTQAAPRDLVSDGPGRHPLV